MTAVATCAQTAAEPKAPKANRAPSPSRKEFRPGGAAKSPGGRNPEAPKGGGAQRLANPGNPVERLMAMPPEKREQILERLPAQQQANLRQRLDRFDKLPAAERARLNQMWNTFNSLPPEKQAIVTRQMQAFNNLPDARREELKPVLQRLRLMTEDKRNALLSSEAFKNRFSPTEVQMLSDISQNYPLPGR
jgi:flagellar motor switch protein FliG